MRTGKLLGWVVLGDMKGVNACKKLCDHLDRLSPHLPETVIIERQSKKSMTMLSIQCWTQCYYVSRGVRVQPIPAKMKSDVLGPGIDNYRKRKKAAVALAAERIPPELQEQWRLLKKKDDVGDTLSQALAWLQRQGVDIKRGIDGDRYDATPVECEECEECEEREVDAAVGQQQ